MTDITENGKYYIPDIEEFHCGFEFEFYSQSGNLLKEYDTIREWTKQICDADWFKRIFDDYEDIENDVIDNYRVKYLDHNDIVDCGWEKRPFLKEFRHFGWGCWFSKDDNSLKWESGLIIIERNDNEYSGKVFVGNILNKSELKFIMKRIGI